MRTLPEAEEPVSPTFALAARKEKNLSVPKKRKSSTKTEQRESVAATNTNISKAELLRLSKLWIDDRLELYNTKLPIPTHLAYLAAKRAQLHLRYDDYKKDDDDNVAPCALAAVHEDVKNTLYFL